MQEYLKEIGFQRITDRLSFGYVNAENSKGNIEESLVMCFVPDEGFGHQNPVYLFRCVEVSVWGFEMSNGVRKRTQKKHFEFYGTGLDKKSNEFWDVSNDINLNILGFDVNCPRCWAYKLRGDLSKEDLQRFVEHFL